MSRPILSAVGVAWLALAGLACSTTPPANWPPSRGADAAAEAEIDAADEDGAQAADPTPAASISASAAISADEVRRKARVLLRRLAHDE